MAKRLLALRSLTLESEQINILVQNPSLFTVNGTPVSTFSPSSGVQPFFPVTPTLDAGTITTIGPTPQISWQIIGNELVLIIKQFSITAIAGGPAHIVNVLGLGSWPGGVFPIPHGSIFPIVILNAGAPANGFLEFLPSPTGPPIQLVFSLVGGGPLTLPFGLFNDVSIGAYTYT